MDESGHSAGHGAQPVGPAARAYAVRAVHCDHEADDEEVYRALRRATAPLARSWARLKRARRIVIKLNQDFIPEGLVYCGRHLQELVSESVARATLRLLREETSAELFFAEVCVFKEDGRDPSETLTLLPLMREFGVSWIDGDSPPHSMCPVPGGGAIFRQYLLPEAVVEADAVVSLQKMKSHAFAGVTLCLKNLFGLTPQEPHGRTRRYFHHLIRLPYVLADLGMVLQPSLNIVDALVAQSGQEWGGEGRITDCLVAGDQVIATDACAAYLMGHDPAADWPTHPFRRERNALLIAAQAGLGTVSLDEIDWQSEVRAPLGEFSPVERDPLATVVRWRRSACEQALHYRDHQRHFVERYGGEYILLQDGEVRWHGADYGQLPSRRVLAGGKPDSALWLKWVDPEEAEGEHFEVYEWELARMQALGLQ